MENVTGILNWGIENWDNVIQAYLQVIGAASIIVKITPTLKDDNLLKGFIKFMGKYVALNRSSKANTTT